MAFIEQTRLLVSKVFGPLSDHHGIDDDLIVAAESRLRLKIPSILRDYYLTAGNHAQVSDGMNHLHKPAALRIKNGYLMFCTENQGCFSAGILVSDLAHDDPPVWECHPRSTYKASERLSDYLLVTFCWQACNSLPSVAQSTVTPAQLERFLVDFPSATFGSKLETETTAFWGELLAIIVFAKSNDAYVASNEDRHLKKFAEV